MNIKRNRNKISIQKICPNIPKESLAINEKNSILGISIDNPATQGSKIEAIFNFLEKSGLPNINLLIGNSLYRYTAIIKYGCDESEGRDIGMEKCKNLISYYEENHSDHKLNILTTSEVEKNKKFNEYYAVIKKVFNENSNFNESISNFAKRFINYSLGKENNNIFFYHCAVEYLIEELAIFSILHQKGFNILLYPGVIQIIYDVIATGDPYISELFKDYFFVALRISRKGA
jgi:tRNA-dependent cyclodipeptide synthase